MKKRARRSSSAGFSLIEMLLVMALMGLLAALIAPGISKSLSNIRLKTAAKKTAAVVRYVRNQAISQKKPYWLVVDREKRKLTVKDKPPQEMPEDREQEAEEPEPSSPPEPVFAYPDDVIIGKLVVGTREIEQPQGAFIFYPNGRCSGGELVLHTDEERFLRVVIDFATATAAIEREMNENE